MAAIDRDPRRAADALDLASIDHARQELERELTDLVEQQRTASRRLERADALRPSAGERACLVPEPLDLEQVRRDRAAIDHDERTLAARALEAE